MKKTDIILKAVMVAIMVLICQTGRSQHVGYEVNAQGFFDNSEGDHHYRVADTYSGFRIQPQLNISTNDNKHQLVGGYDALLESGAHQSFDGNGLLAYYQYDTEQLRILMGKYPRRLQQEEMEDYLLCDSLKYYRPYMTGFDFLYRHTSGYFEAFLDWTAKRTETVREQFMAGILTRFNQGPFFWGLNGYYYHWANELHGSAMGHSPHDNLLAHPYIGISRQNPWLIDSLEVRTGLLVQCDRDRATDHKWHVLPGFLGEAEAYWKRFGVKQLLYLGKRQQYYGQDGFGQYYWGDTYYRSPYYWRSDLSYMIVSDQHVKLKFGLVFHLSDHGLHYHQMLTLSANIGQEKKK